MCVWSQGEGLEAGRNFQTKKYMVVYTCGPGMAGV